MKHLTAVVFDMDGLMLDTEVIGKRSWEHSATKIGLSLPLDYYPRVIGRTTASIRPLLLEWFGQDFPVDTFIAESNRFYQESIHSQPPAIKQGLTELLKALAVANIPCGVATSTRRASAIYKLTVTGILPYFKAVTAGDEVTNSKPAPDIYLRAVEKLGISPKQCLALEDSEAGIRSAKAAGLTAFMVPDLVTPSQEIRDLADGIFDNLDNVQAWLRTHTAFFS